MKESTRNVFRMHGLRVDRALHNYLYFTQYDRYVKLFLKLGRLTAARLGRLSVARVVFGVVFNRYHAKVITGPEAAKIFRLNRSLELGPDVAERVIPFPYAKRIILSEPEFIAVMDCPCRLSREHGCRPVNVCIAVGRTTAEFWLDHGAKYHARRIGQEEALRIVREARARGNITTAWFKVATGGRTGVICSCCSCCCGGLEGMRLARSVKGGEALTNLAPSGWLVEHRRDLCENCGQCQQVCMFDAIEMDPQGFPVYHPDRCLGCGLCVEKCPQAARSLKLGPGLLPLDLDLLTEKSAGRPATG